MSAVLIDDCLREAQDLGRRLESELLLGKVLNVSRETVFAHPERLLSEGEWSQYRNLWERVRAGEPVAYILGRKEFFGLEFVVNEAVLIPRPETEHLVETVIDLVKEIDEPRILDVGTGSGAIALSLAHSLPKARVWASDVSEDALEVARVNADRFELREVQFFVSDLLSDLKWGAWDLNVMVANLPYIGTQRFDFVEKFVKEYEPNAALFGGEDGLRLYDRLFQQVSFSGLSQRPRWIVGEFGSLQRDELEIMIRRHFPTASLVFHTDLAGLDRFFTLNLAHA